MFPLLRVLCVAGVLVPGWCSRKFYDMRPGRGEVEVSQVSTAVSVRRFSHLQQRRCGDVKCNAPISAISLASFNVIQVDEEASSKIGGIPTQSADKRKTLP